MQLVKAGYGKLINRPFNNQGKAKRLKAKNYVEIVDTSISFIDALKDYRERDFREYAKSDNFQKILKIENIIVDNLITEL
jgi:hypothetical protein